MLNIEILGNNWGDGLHTNIHALLNNVASHFTRHFREPIFATIEVKNSADEGPVILWRQPGENAYTIVLSTEGTYWSQYTYQFAQEFCHLFTDFERHRGSANGWFFETLCETASLFALRSMGETWQQDPPYPNWRNYAQSLTDYANNAISNADPSSPVDGPLGYWLWKHEIRARENATMREANRAVAVRMLPIFEQTPMGWNAVKDFPVSEAPIDWYLALWKVSANECDRDFISRIQASLGLPSR